MKMNDFRTVSVDAHAKAARFGVPYQVRSSFSLLGFRTRIRRSRISFYNFISRGPRFGFHNFIILIRRSWFSGHDFISRLRLWFSGHDFASRFRRSGFGCLRLRQLFLSLAVQRPRLCQSCPSVWFQHRSPLRIPQACQSQQINAPFPLVWAAMVRHGSWDLGFFWVRSVYVTKRGRSRPMWWKLPDLVGTA